jgi:hypothetical protein
LIAGAAQYSPPESAAIGNGAFIKTLRRLTWGKNVLALF